MNAFDVLMNAQKRKKDTPVKKLDVKEPQCRFDTLKGRTNAFDLLRAPQPPKKKSKLLEEEEAPNHDRTEEEFTLNFDRKSSTWSWSWITAAPKENKETLHVKADDYPAPKLPLPVPNSAMINKTLQTFINEPGIPPKLSSEPNQSLAPRVIVIKQEPEVAHKSTVNVKLPGVHNSRVTLLGNYRKSKPEWPKKNGKNYYLAPSLLKSMLQKNVRRCRPEAAVRVAAELIRCDWLQFIRRLPVIMLEDSFLHPLLPAVIWLMLASSSSQDTPEFVPSKEHIDLCLQVVWDIAECKYRDASFVFFPIYKAPTKESITQLPPPQQALVKSLIARAAYGGMKCDVAMLCSHAGAWTKRFQSDYDGWCSLLGAVYPKSDGGKVTISHKEVGQIGPEDIILAGADFHCTPILDYVLTDPRIFAAMRELGYTENDAKDTMWYFRSGVTYKMSIEPGLEVEMQSNKTKEENKEKLEKLWAIIEDPCDEWSVQFITKKYDFKITN